MQNENKQILEYKLVYDDRSMSFAKDINNLLEEGWTLYGSPFSMHHHYCQALTRPQIPIKRQQKRKQVLHNYP